MYMISTGNYLPGEPISNEMLSENFGSTVNLIGDYFGVNSRYLAIDHRTGKHRNEFNSDLCCKAVNNALSKINLDINKIGIIISSSNSPDTLLPQLSVSIQEKLGIKKALTIDIRGGCSAPLQGMLIAQNFIEQGMSEYAIVVGSECFSTIYYEHLLKNKKTFLAKDIMNTLIFGDGAAAVILSKNKIGQIDFEIESIKSSSEFTQWPSGFVVSLGGSKVPHVGDPNVSLGELMKHYPKHIENYMPKVIEYTLKQIIEEGYDIKNFRYMIGPQANKRLITKLNELFKIQSTNYFYYGDVTGNIPGGALLLAFNRLNETTKINSDEKVLIMGIESPKWIYGYCVLRKV